MAIEIISGFKNNSRTALDARSGPYPDTASALASIPAENRYVGLPVIIISSPQTDSSGNFIGGTVSRYIFNGGIGDEHLVEDAAAGGVGSSDGVLTGAVIDANGDLVLSFSQGLPDIVVNMNGVGGELNRTVSTLPPASGPTTPGEEYIVLSDTVYTT